MQEITAYVYPMPMDNLNRHLFRVCRILSANAESTKCSEGLRLWE